ncbi:hypothetical protein N6N90_11600, partial [Escherichia coli]|nr:hypothetical protein [Escherichia sp. NIC18-1]MDC6802744.1 hypothetical protein [Escherichia coli]MDC7055562.1 hypothetical protein [Escherichia coli]
SAQIREILINESAWEEMTCLFAPSLVKLKVPGSTIKNRSPFFTCLKYVQQPILMATSSPR